MLSKKTYTLSILNILKEHTDENNPITISEIDKLLEPEYGPSKDRRKTIKSYLMDLIDLGYNVDYTEIPRKNKHGEEETIYTKTES